jgi:L-fuculose-phosphate aldolase
MNGPALRKAVVLACRQLHERGWVANHDGNVTAREAPDRFLATPTAVSKGAVTEEMLLTVNSAGVKVAGQRQVFSEINLHMAVYQARGDVRAVVHAHPPAATARACAGLALAEPFLPEAVVSLGPSVPLVRFALPGPAAVAALEPYLEAFDAVLLQSHGVLTWGGDPETALLRLELVEHLCRIARDAAPYGGVRPLPADALQPLLEARTRAGLGVEGRKAKQPRFMKPQDDASHPARTPMEAMRKVTGAARE